MSRLFSPGEDAAVTNKSEMDPPLQHSSSTLEKPPCDDLDEEQQPTLSRDAAPGTEAHAVPGVEPGQIPAGKADVVAATTALDDLVHVLDTEHVDATPQEVKWLVLKLDITLSIAMAIAVCLTQLDKATLNYAHLFKEFELDLKLDPKSGQFSWLGSVFYFGYLAGSLLHPLAFQRTHLGRYLGLMTFSWGVVLTLHATAFNYAGMIVCRFFLGLFESCINPGFILLTSRFYRKEEVHTRVAWWFSFNGWAMVLGGLIEFGILRQSRAAIPLWKELYIIIGLGITVTFGVYATLVLPSTPEDFRWFTPRERLISLQRQRDNQTGITNRTFKPYQLREALVDPRLYILFVLIIAQDIANGGLTTFSTTIMSGLGFDQQRVALLSMSIGLSEVVSVLVLVLLTKWTKRHWIADAFVLIVAIAGAAVMAAKDKIPNSAQMGGLALMFWFAAPSLSMYSLLGTGFAGETKRVAVNAIFQVGYAAGNIIGPQTYRAKDAPSYIPAKASGLACLVLTLICFMLIYSYHAYENRKRDQLYGTPSELEHTASDDLGDRTDFEKAAFFRYGT